MVELTDSEVAVIIDCLGEQRDLIRSHRKLRGHEDWPASTPNIDTALWKINSLITPTTNGLRIEAI